MIDTDEILIRRAQAGDASASERLLESYRSRLVRFFTRRVSDGNEADTLAQQTIIEAFKSLSKFSAECPFDRWIFGIGSRVALNHFRRQKPTTNIEDSPEIVDEQVDPTEAKLWITGLLEAAKMACSEVEYLVLMTYYRCESFEETAEMLDM
ncbi:MAG: RNA polymerase sigma factor, partial [Armatimonadetes bacterium]|nr:RNA polymerase sigma factor [Armatimonadota bacterium]